MTPDLHARIVAVLSAWLSGSAMLDSLGPDTAALLAELQDAPPTRSRRATKAKPAECQTVDTSALSHAALFAYYKRTSLREDCRFWLAHARLSDALRSELAALLAELETRASTPADRRRYHALQDAWRIEANARERVEAAALREAATRNRITRRMIKARMRLSKSTAVAA